MENSFIVDMSFLHGNIATILNKNLFHFLKKFLTKSTKKWKNKRENNHLRKKRTRKA